MWLPQRQKLSDQAGQMVWEWEGGVSGCEPVLFLLILEEGWGTRTLPID